MVLTWIQEKIDLWWGLILQLDPWTCLFLFLIYGAAFEYFYAMSLYAYRDMKRTLAASLNVLLFLLSLWGLNEALNENLMYALPISVGSFLGTFVQVTMEKRKHKNETEAGGASSDTKDTK